MIYLLLPLIAGIAWGVFYACMENSLQNISMATWCVLAGVSSVVVGLFLAPQLTGEGLNFKPLLKKENMMVFLGALVAMQIADISIILAMKHLPSTIVVVGEISYVVFVPIMAYLMFNSNQISPHTAVGALVVVLGIGVVMYGQVNKSNTSGALQTAETTIEQEVMLPEAS